MGTCRPFLYLCFVLSLGCGESQEGTNYDPADLQRYAGLPGLSKTHHTGLRAELNRLVSERATPELLATGATLQSQLPGGLPERRLDGNQALRELLPEQDLDQLQKELKPVYPAGNFQFSPRGLERADRLCSKYGELRAALAEVLGDPGLTFALDHTRGLGADTTFVDAVRAAGRLEALGMANMIERGQLHATIDSLSRLFVAAKALAQVRHLVPRISAVHMRAELLEIMRSICDHPQADATVYERLLTLVGDQLDQLPADADAWIGERADGLHTYELIRDGYLLSVLSYQEIREYREEIGVQRFGKLVMDNLDEDEHFYLAAMRGVIHECQRPFYQRQTHLKEFDRQLEQRREQADYPIIADHLLLSDLVVGQRHQALDRARLEAWQLALSVALGHDVSSSPNPLTGYLYLIDKSPKQVVVDGIDDQGQESSITLRLQASR